MADAGNNWANVTRRLSFAPACFIMADEVTKKLSGADICQACEDVAGLGTLDGCQRLGGLWRLYAKDNKARSELLVKGIVLCGIAVSVLDNNPFIANQSNDRPTVKITIGGVPHSYANSVIESSLKKMKGVELCSKIFDEKYRVNGELTSWKSGRRFAFVVKPQTPLPSFFQVGDFSYKIC